VTRFDLPPPPPGILEKSNSEALEAFLAALAAAGASPKTVKAYRAAILDFLEWLGGKPLREATSSDVAAWIYDRLQRGLRRPRSRDPVEERRERQATMHYYTLFLRSFLQWLGLPVKVPVVRKPRARRVEALSGEEVARLIAAARDTLDLLIVALLFETGLRAREAVELRLRDIDFSRREIRVRSAKYGEERVVLYGPLTEQALRRWLAENPPRGPGDRLLGISYSGLYKRLKSLARRAGLDPRRVRPHVLRHTFATEALRRGVPLPAVQRLLGHRDIKVTQVYLHLLDEDIRRAYQAAFQQPPVPQQAPIQWSPQPWRQPPPWSQWPAQHPASWQQPWQPQQWSTPQPQAWQPPPSQPPGQQWSPQQQGPQTPPPPPWGQPAQQPAQPQQPWQPWQQPPPWSPPAPAAQQRKQQEAET